MNRTIGVLIIVVIFLSLTIELNSALAWDESDIAPIYQKLLKKHPESKLKQIWYEACWCDDKTSKKAAFGTKQWDRLLNNCEQKVRKNAGLTQEEFDYLKMFVPVYRKWQQPPFK